MKTTYTLRDYSFLTCDHHTPNILFAGFTYHPTTQCIYCFLTKVARHTRNTGLS